MQKNNSQKNQNNLAFHPGPVQPPSGEGSPLQKITLEEQNACYVYASSFVGVMVYRVRYLTGYEHPYR